MERPSPVPRPAPLVVKIGSTTRYATAGDIPTAVSSTDSTT
jgi:hypothetical protein